ncbi:MAG: hypothetical protein KGI41_01725 [Patescibacteria group bacterium]|nr:hypothetical protein [Patescibacteria group bacterium]MDE1965946.1 hypothetical protein [Patescibacteria group bacterium]
MAGLDYSQKRLLSAALHAKKRGKHSKRLMLYAFLTGLMSTIISLMHLILTFVTGK